MNLFHFFKGSISWECLPFSSKRQKEKNAKAKKAKNVKNTAEGGTYKKSTTLNPITDRSFSSEDDAYESMSSSKVKQTDKKPAPENKSKAANGTAQQTTKHPYSASLVNNGFGFGFDLQGGDGDNQLTFIVNCHKNGDAAKKGLSDGKF